MKSIFNIFLIYRNRYFLIISDSDILIGGLNANLQYSKNYIPLISHLWDDKIVCFKNPEHLPRWLYLFLVTDRNSYNLWLYGAIIILIDAFLIFIYTELETKQINAFELLLFGFAIVMGLSVNINKYCTRITSRFYLATLLFEIFCIISVYNAMFFDILMHQKYPQRINTLNEAISLKYSFLSTVEIMVEFASLYLNAKV